MSKEVDFRDGQELNFTREAESNIDSLIPVLDEDDIDPSEIEDCLYEDGAEIIYSFLTTKTSPHSFAEHLKRYIYREAGLSGDFSSIPDEEYRDIIIDAFRDNFSDFSFYPTKAHKADVVRDWLKRKAVSRETVLLLGFGLKMSLEDVNVEFLHKALHEPFLDPKEPLEAVCHYCFRKQYPFPRFRKIWDRFDPAHPAVEISGGFMNTTEYQDNLELINTDEEMLAYLYQLPRYKKTKRQSLTARMEFDRLYESITNELSRRNRKDEGTEAGPDAERRAEEADSPVAAGNADIENVLYASVPKTPHKNYESVRKSTLRELFFDKRLNRQHIGEIQRGKAPISRFDLITMCFLNYDLQRHGDANDAKKHYEPFVEEMNNVLNKCNMDDLYPANPYECFIMLCMKTESPIETYSEVWGMSYGA